MITVDQIYAATNGGLDIIFDIYPQARGCEETKNKHFKAREGENTASACLRKFGDVWKVTDFGGSGHAESAIDIYIRENNIERFPDAVLQLASRYGVSDELKKEVNRPDIRKVAATQDQKDGTRVFELNEKFTESELKVLGPKVTQEDVDALHWHSAKCVGYVKNREVTLKYSNEHYPIFMRECLVSPAHGETAEVKFYKIYEPLNPDKGWRFSYTPEGVKPKQYINGFSELKKAYNEFNANEEAEFKKDPSNEDKPYHEQKLPEAFICSGERDSLCVKSLGFHPLWFNSETYKISVEEYREIMKFTEVLYNVPDIDETGLTKGKELALRFIDIRTIWLPSWLRSYHDNRGHARKDFRDWIELRQNKQDFKNLMKLAMPAKFWVSRTDKNGNWTHSIDTACLFNFLMLNGFYSLHDENSAITRYVRITGNIVKEINTKDIREFVREWVVSRYEDRDILNLVLNTPRLASAALDSLQEIDLDFTSYTPKTQLFFFPKTSIEVSKDGMKEYKGYGSTLNNYVWEDSVINHDVKISDKMFEISHDKNEDGKEVFSIKINDVSSHFFGFMINASRIYWRKEMEYDFEGDESAAKKYRSEHLFDIAGEGLSKKEIDEQKQNLINKIFVFGYMLHHFKSPSRAWAPMAMDNKIGEDNECNGRSGKSFFFKVLSILMKSVKLSGRNPKLMDNPHVFDQVNQHTEMLLLDDCDRYLNTGLFYDNITSDMTVNPKNNQSFTIPFEVSPKIAFTTNYVPADFDPSSEARLIYMVFSDYYHQKTENNDYKESRSIRDDFGKDLYSQSYTNEEWNADINFFMQCCEFYLSISESALKILPPMDNIIRRKYKADMGMNFEDWANSYLSVESGHLDKFIVRKAAFEDFRMFCNSKNLTMQTFSRKLKSFVALCPYISELNPKDYCNSSNRIIRRPDSDTIGGSNMMEPVEMLYIASNSEAVKEMSKKDDDEVLPF